MGAARACCYVTSLQHQGECVQSRVDVAVCVCGDLSLREPAALGLTSTIKERRRLFIPVKCQR